MKTKWIVIGTISGIAILAIIFSPLILEAYYLEKKYQEIDPQVFDIENCQDTDQCIEWFENGTCHMMLSKHCIELDDSTYDLEIFFNEEEYAVEYFVVNGSTDYIEIEIPTNMIDGVFMIHVNDENVDDHRVSIDGDTVIVNYGQNIETVKLFGYHHIEGKGEKQNELYPTTKYYDPVRYYAIFTETGPLGILGVNEKGDVTSGTPLLSEINCIRYATWLTEFQKEKIDIYEDYPRYPPWGNEIFPLVDYCVANGDLVKTIKDDKIHWEFQLENEN